MDSGNELTGINAPDKNWNIMLSNPNNPVTFFQTIAVNATRTPNAIIDPNPNITTKIMVNIWENSKLAKIAITDKIGIKKILVLIIALPIKYPIK